MSTRKSTRGFTLVETVVVMAVILLLAGIVVPALWSGKERTYTAECQQQLRGIGRAFANYHGDFSGWLPRCDLVFVGNSTKPVEQKSAGDNASVPNENALWKMQLTVYMDGYTWYDFNEWVTTRHGRMKVSEGFVDPTRGDTGKGVYMASAGQLSPITSQAVARDGYYDAAIWEAAMRELGYSDLHREMTMSERNSVAEKAKQIAANPRPLSALYTPPSLQDFRYLAAAAIVGPSRKTNVHFSYTDSITLTKSEYDANLERTVSSWHKVTSYNKKTLAEFAHVDFRHEGGRIANVLFLDGHAIAYSKRDGPAMLELLRRWNKRHEFKR